MSTHNLPFCGEITKTINPLWLKKWLSRAMQEFIINFDKKLYI